MYAEGVAARFKGIYSAGILETHIRKILIEIMEESEFDVWGVYRRYCRFKV